MEAFEPSYTVMHVRCRSVDAADAVSHLVSSPGTTTAEIAAELGREIADKDGWSTIPVSELAARAIAPRLAALLGRPVVSVTVDAEQVQLSVVRPDGRPAGHASEIAAALGSDQAAALEGALANKAISPHKRHVRAAGVLRIGLPGTDRVPGVVVAQAPATTLRNQLAGAGRGAWVVPREGGYSLIVPDGSGWTPDLVSALHFDTRFHDAVGAPLVGITWGSPPKLWARSRDDAIVLLLQQGTIVGVEKLMDILGRTSDVEAARQALRPGTQPNNRAIELLKLIGVGKVPVGASVEQLAEWASNRTDALRVREHGRNVSLTYDDPELLRKGFTRRRLLRRVRTGFGWLEFLAWLGLFGVLIWGPRPYWWVPAAAIAGLIVVRMGLKRLIQALS